MVQGGTGGPRVIMGAVHASDGMWALVEGVVLSHSPTVVAWWWRLQPGIQHVIWAYLDGRNRVGKIPS